MTFKDYAMLAVALKTVREDMRQAGREAAVYGIDIAARAIADTLAHDNPQFDAAHFLKSLGVTP